MAETLGSLVDKLAIVNLKLWHWEERAHRKDATLEEMGQAKAAINDLNSQRALLVDELNTFFADTLKRLAEGSASVRLPLFAQHKNYEG